MLTELIPAALRRPSATRYRRPIGLQRRVRIAASLSGRIGLLLAVTISLVSIPVPVLHAHADTAPESMVNSWLSGHLQRCHGSDEAADNEEVDRLTGSLTHIHFVLPCQVSRELGCDPELPAEPGCDSLVVGPTSPQFLVISGSFVNSTRRTGVVPLPRIRCVVPVGAVAASEFLGCYQTSVPLCALIGIARL